ncbi:IclR family transcriptional regulator [Microvirga thermotolerans]|uniref:Helix-turn-helix domain-containing protein n=1 Tax=Microvirga thermotolerans TaxID=2651334 RepID=A0A5P9K1L4_9HYPH|nr:helix-turn-helix domain-containing protein [Microvirga thermotolerans]QFU16104.1 helix-turn-helix domain-containing protein [Microvirga thermotolerans]
MRGGKKTGTEPGGHGQKTAPARTNQLQTLDRGLQALGIVAQSASGITIADLAARLDIHRAIVYRIVSTLESHALVSRTPEGQIHLGGGILVLASRFEPQLRSIARPMLQRLAQDTRATAFISVAQAEECVVIMVAEPEEGLLRVGYRVGSRHPLTLGAAGIAILAGRPEGPDDPEAVRQARRDGFSLTRGQLQRGAVGVASPIHLPDRPRTGFEACIGVVAMDDLDTETAIAAVRSAARKLASLMQA